MKIIQKLLTQALCKYSKADGGCSMFKSWRVGEYVCAKVCRKYFRHMGAVSNPFPLPSIIHTGTPTDLSPQRWYVRSMCKTLPVTASDIIGLSVYGFIALRSLESKFERCFVIVSCGS